MDHKMIQKQKKRWSVMDTVILLLVLMAVAGLIYRVVYAARKDVEADPTLYRVYFEVLETHEKVLAEVEGFDAVYLCENGTRLGYIGVYQDTATGEYTAALTVMLSALQLISLPLNGLGNGMQPFVSYNYGRGNEKRLKAGIRDVTVIAFIFAVVMWSGSMLFPGIYAKLFSASPK